MDEQTTTINDEELAGVLKEFYTTGGTLGAIRGIGEEELEAVYLMAYNFYTNGKFKDAEKAFKFLCFYDHMEKKYFIGLAATRQMMKLYPGAVQAYAYASLLDVGDPMPSLHAADCFLAEGKYAEAQSALSATVHWAGEKEEYKPVKERAETLLALLEQGQKEESEQ